MTNEEIAREIDQIVATQANLRQKVKDLELASNYQSLRAHFDLFKQSCISEVQIAIGGLQNNENKIIQDLYRRVIKLEELNIKEEK